MADNVDLAALARDVRRLSDIEAVRRVKHAYFRCIDTAAHDELRTLFHPEVTTELIGATYSVRLNGPDEYVDFIRTIIHAGIVAQHNGHHPEIDILSETEATGRWYLEDVFIDLDKGTRMYGTALYDDTYAKLDGKWLIKHSRYRRIFEVLEPLDKPPNLTAHMLSETGYRHPEGQAVNLQEAVG